MIIVGDGKEVDEELMVRASEGSQMRLTKTPPIIKKRGKRNINKIAIS